MTEVKSLSDVNSNAVAVAEGSADVRSDGSWPKGSHPKSVKGCELQRVNLSRASDGRCVGLSSKALKLRRVVG